MTSNFLIGPVKDGLRKDLKPYAIPEDAFEVLTNAYQWRGRIVRRDGYDLLGILTVDFDSSPTTILLTGLTGAGNVLTGFSLPTTYIIVPGTVTITDTVTMGLSYSDTNADGVLIGTPSGAGTINYITGEISIGVSTGHTVTALFDYYPSLPVMGLRTRELFGIDVQQLIAFDTINAYSFSGGAFGLLDSVMPVVWSGLNYQFFWTTNYANSFWATNSKSGLHGWYVTLFANQMGTGLSATVDVTAAGNKVAVGDSVYFFNITDSATKANNLIFAQVIAIDVGSDPDVFTVQATSFPNGVNSFSNGSVTAETGWVLDSQQSITGQDGIRYYANCTTLGNAELDAIPVGNTWVNYNPPIDANTVLTGALMIFPYRGYLVFLNTWEFTGSLGVSQNYQQRARWAFFGTPYYSSPVPNTPSLSGVNPTVMRSDLFGQGDFSDAPTNELIIGAAFIRDILVVYFERSTWRLRYVNNAQNPFSWERVNVEFGSDCTFGCVPFDKGLMTMGNRGIVISDGNDTLRFDEKIPDDVFNLRQENQTSIPCHLHMT